MAVDEDPGTITDFGHIAGVSPFAELYVRTGLWAKQTPAAELSGFVWRSCEVPSHFVPLIMMDGEAAQGPYERGPEFIGMAEIGSGEKLAGRGYQRRTVSAPTPLC